MARERKVPLETGREAVLKPELTERPTLGSIVAIVRIIAPWWPGASRRKTIQFLEGLVAAFRIRARDEPDLTVVSEGNRVVVRRRLSDGRSEVRFERDGRRRGTLHCDKRELENLHALGILSRAKVYQPKCKTVHSPPDGNADDSR